MQRDLHTIDANDRIAGRIATEIAVLLQGKNKVSYQPHIDGGDMVKVVNVSGMKFSGKKLENKKYHHSTGYIGNLKTENLSDLFEKNPEEVLRKMVFGMLPKNKLRDRMIKRLTLEK